MAQAMAQLKLLIMAIVEALVLVMFMAMVEAIVMSLA